VLGSCLPPWMPLGAAVPIRHGLGSLGRLICTAAMADLQMVNSKDAEKLGLSSTLVTHEEWEAAKGEQGNGGVPLEPATPPESAETEDLPDECEDPVTAAAVAAGELLMLDPDEAAYLGLPSGLVSREDYQLAVTNMDIAEANHPDRVEAAEASAAEAAAADAVLFGDGPQEAQEAAPEEPDVSVEAGVAKKPRKGRKPATGDDSGQSVVDDPATTDGTEALEG